MTRILITGGRGFLGRNLSAHLLGLKDCQTSIFARENSEEDLGSRLLEADVIFHLAGVNRSQDPAEFVRGNAGLTEQICQILKAGGRSPKVIFSSSIQVELDNHYGRSKAKAEIALRDRKSVV